MMNVELPEAFLSRMHLQLGSELPAFLCAMEEPPVRGLRINPLKPESRNCQISMGDPIPWEKNGWYIPEGLTPGTTLWHEAGAFYLQDPGAMIPVNVLNPRPGEMILDLCAAPGGKSTQIAAAMEGKGLLVCNEPIPKRAQVLSRNLERMGVRNAVAVSAMPDKLAEKWPEGFDAVLVDAPCSGEGMFRREPETRLEWTADQAAGCARRQMDILNAAALLVRPGGRMVYATCTFNPAENEENVERFLNMHPDWETEEFHLPGVDGNRGMFTCFPHRTRGEGQFAALLRKKGDTPAMIPEDGSLPRPGRDTGRLLKEQFPFFPSGTHMFGSTVVHMPFCPDLKGIRIYRLGLHLAECREKRVIPDHASASAAIEGGAHINLTDEAALRFMAGETVNGEQTGWTVACWNGMPLGWGKGSNGVIKNHLPKGLRNGRLTLNG